MLKTAAMKYGLLFANVGPFGEPDGAAELGAICEEVGIESVWTVEHVVVPTGYASEYPYARSGRMAGGEDSPIPDPLVWLTWVAAHTTTLRLATGILILPQRNPVVLAKEVATLDRLSKGRVTLGIGVGWLREEFDALGVPFAERGARTDEHVAVMRAAVERRVGRLRRRVHHARRRQRRSRTRSQASVPIVVGGHSPAAARRAGRLGDGFFPAQGRLGRARARDARRGDRRRPRPGRDRDHARRRHGPRQRAAAWPTRAPTASSSRRSPSTAAGLRDALARFADEVITKVA